MGMHIVTENPNDKEKMIQLLEGDVCVSCGASEIRFVKLEKTDAFQYHYKCPACGTQWVGNLYDKNTYEQTKPNRIKDFLETSSGKMLGCCFVVYAGLLYHLPIFSVLMSILGVFFGICEFRKEKKPTFLLVALVFLGIALIAFRANIIRLFSF